MICCQCIEVKFVQREICNIFPGTQGKQKTKQWNKKKKKEKEKKSKQISYASKPKLPLLL